MWVEWEGEQADPQLGTGTPGLGQPSAVCFHLGTVKWAWAVVPSLGGLDRITRKAISSPDIPFPGPWTHSGGQMTAVAAVAMGIPEMGWLVLLSTDTVFSRGSVPRAS